MRGRGEEIPWEPLSVGNTRPAVFKALGIPFLMLIPVLFIPVILAAVTQNPFWLLLILVLAWAARTFMERDHNRPRRLWLSIVTGVFFGSRDPTRWGGHTADPHGKPGARIGGGHVR